VKCCVKHTIEQKGTGRILLFIVEFIFIKKIRYGNQKTICKSSIKMFENKCHKNKCVEAISFGGKVQGSTE
jgi:hypothetical protein